MDDGRRSLAAAARRVVRSPLLWLLAAVVLGSGVWLWWLALPQPAAVTIRYARSLEDEEAVLRKMLERTPTSETLRLRLIRNLRFQYLHAYGEAFRQARLNEGADPQADVEFRKAWAAGPGAARLDEILRITRELSGSEDGSTRNAAAGIENWAFRELSGQGSDGLGSPTPTDLDPGLAPTTARAEPVHLVVAFD